MNYVKIYVKNYVVKSDALPWLGGEWFGGRGDLRTAVLSNDCWFEVTAEGCPERVCGPKHGLEVAAHIFLQGAQQNYVKVECL